jgi:hypothetical protein
MLIKTVCAAVIWGVSAGGANASLVISGVVDGPLAGGRPKAVELYASTDIADLSIYGFGVANNGGGSDGEELMLSGNAAAGQYLYVSAETAEFENVFGFTPDFVNSFVVSINGDDALELFENGELIDTFGEIDVPGTGQPWEYTDSWAYRTDDAGLDGSPFSIANWYFGGPNALDGLDAAGTRAAVPFGTYSAVPLPAAVWLFGSALVGLVGIGKRRV